MKWVDMGELRAYIDAKRGYMDEQWMSMDMYMEIEMNWRCIKGFKRYVGKKMICNVVKMKEMDEID